MYLNHILNHRNRVVHIIFVPLLFWSTMAFLAFCPVLIVWNTLPINASFCVSFSLVFYYALLEPIAGVRHPNVRKFVF